MPEPNVSVADVGHKLPAAPVSVVAGQEVCVAQLFDRQAGCQGGEGGHPAPPKHPSDGSRTKVVEKYWK